MLRVSGMLLLIVLVGEGALTAQDRSPRVRLIPDGVGMTIAERLLPGDEVVVIQRPIDASVYNEQPSASDIIMSTVEISGIIAVVTVDEVTPFLVDEDTWINTRIVTTVEDVVLVRRRSVSAGQALEFHFVGGEIMIGHVLVKAWEPPVLRNGKRYLIFLDNNSAKWATHAPLLIDGERLVSTRPVERGVLGRTIRDPLDGLSLNDVIEEVRRLAR